MRVKTLLLLTVLVAGGLLLAETPADLGGEYAALREQFAQRMNTISSRAEYQTFLADRQKELDALLTRHQADPASDANELARGRILADLERFADADAKFAALAAKGGDISVSAKFEQVKLRLQQEQAAPALSLYREIEAKLTPSPDLAEVWLQLAFSGGEPAAREEFSRKFLAASDLPAEMIRYRSQVYGNLADIAVERGDRAGAIKILEDGIAAAKDPEQARSLRATLKQMQLSGQPAPAISAVTWLNSAPLALEGLKGRVVVIDFWAPWCGPCRQVIPHLIRFHNELKDRGLTVIGFTKLYGNYRDDTQNKGEVKPEEETELIKGFVSRIAIPYAVAVAGGGEAFEAYGVTGIPTLVVIGRDGKVAEVKVGSGGEEKLRATIEKLLAEK
jgi:thiol-disulfide isomerase/thioredoxin